MQPLPCLRPSSRLSSDSGSFCLGLLVRTDHRVKAVAFCLLTHIPWALPSFALCSWHTSLFSCFHPYSLLVLNAEDVCPKSGRGLLCMVLACSPGWTGHGGAHKKRLFGSLRQTDLNQGDGCLSGGLTRRAACFGFQGSLCTVAGFVGWGHAEAECPGSGRSESRDNSFHGGCRERKQLVSRFNLPKRVPSGFPPPAKSCH